MEPTWSWKPLGATVLSPESIVLKTLKMWCGGIFNLSASQYFYFLYDLARPKNWFTVGIPPGTEISPSPCPVPAHLSSPISACCGRNRVVSISIITKVSNLIPIWRSMRHRLERNMLASKCQMWAPDGNRNGNGIGNGPAIEIGSRCRCRWDMGSGNPHRVRRKNLIGLAGI